MKLYQKIIRRPILLFLLIGIGSFGLISAVKAQTIARVGLLHDMEIRPGVEVEIPIDIEDVVDLYGIDIELKFDPEYWEFRDADPNRQGIQAKFGDFLDPGMMLFNIIDPEEGRIHLVVSQVRPSEGKTGDGNIMVLYATPLKTGTTGFEVSNVEMSTRDGEDIPVEGVDGEVRIANPPPLQVFFNPDPATIDPETNKTVINLEITDAEALWAYDIAFEYDENIAMVDAFEVVDIFGATVCPLSVNNPGNFRIFCSTSQGTPVNGDATAVKLTFSGVNPGETALSFTSITFSDKDQKIIPHVADDGLLEVIEVIEQPKFIYLPMILNASEQGR